MTFPQQTRPDWELSPAKGLLKSSAWSHCIESGLTVIKKTTTSSPAVWEGKTNESHL